MIGQAIPPVRRPVRRLHSAAGLDLGRQFFGTAAVALLDSGTAALARALQLCRQSHGPAAEAIVPAYACPDLITACRMANVVPRLIDVAKDAWGFDLPALQRSLGPQTAAVVAVNFLGLGDDAATLKSLLGTGPALIQDSAQCLPHDRGHVWHGRFVTFSFGRGKPLNLLGGGALLAPGDDCSAAALTEGLAVQERSMAAGLRTGLLGGMLFNAATSPGFYGWISRLPGMQLGTTRYQLPRPITALPAAAWKRYGAALEHYRFRPGYDAARWSPLLEQWRQRGLTALTAPGTAPGAELLRLPLLAASRQMRDRIVAAAKDCGVSAMYELPLHRIGGVPADIAAQGPFPNAEDLAGRLLTLPTHSGVTPQVMRRVDGAVMAAA